MIPRRYAWLLRDAGTLYTTHGARGGFCKLCDALERPGPTWHPHAAQARHLAAHRAEKITRDPDPNYDRETADRLRRIEVPA